MTKVYIQNPWTGLVIDVKPKPNEITPTAGSPLFANTKDATNSNGANFQRWTIVEITPPTIRNMGGWQVIQNADLHSQDIPGTHTKSPFCIDILGGGTQPAKGTPLDAFPEKGNWIETSNQNQVWGFYKDSTSDHYFIASALDGLVIDIMEHGLPHGQPPKAGAGLDAYMQKSSNNRNQLWQLMDTAGALVIPPASPVLVVPRGPGPSGNPVQR